MSRIWGHYCTSYTAAQGQCSRIKVSQRENNSETTRDTVLTVSIPKLMYLPTLQHLQVEMNIPYSEKSQTWIEGLYIFNKFLILFIKGFQSALVTRVGFISSPSLEAKEPKGLDKLVHVYQGANCRLSDRLQSSHTIYNYLEWHFSLLLCLLPSV